MSRLPTPGGDNDTWGDVLNDFLLVEHTVDGTLKSAVKTINSIAPTNGAVTLAASDIGAASNTDMAAKAPLASPAFTGTPTKGGSALISQSDANSTYLQLDTAFVRPEDYGIIGNGADAAAINAAIQAIAGANAQGDVLLTQAYNLEAPIVLQTGVNLRGAGAQINRQLSPPTLTNPILRPSSSFTGTALVTIGTAGQSASNPNGVKLQGLGLSGMTAGGTLISGLMGISATDTSDIHLFECRFVDFDRTDANGIAVSLSSTIAGQGLGFQMQHCIIAQCWKGILADGAGMSDMRISDNLFTGVTKGVDLGPTAGGGGSQFTNNHWTYSGMPSTGFHLSLGSQSGDFMISNEYYDNAGSAVIVQLGSAKGVMHGCHFLASSTSTATGLVKLSTSGSQQLHFIGNQCNANGSAIKSLLWISAHAGAPTGGVYTGNSVYGSPSALVAVIIDSALATVAEHSGSAPYVAGNYSFT